MFRFAGPLRRQQSRDPVTAAQATDPTQYTTRPSCPRTHDTYNCLHEACHMNDFVVAKFILERGLPHVNELTPLGFTPLTLAMKKNGLRLARLLLSKGASLSPPKMYGGTALMIVFHLGFRKMNELVVEKGADLEAQDIDGKTALHLAAHKQRVGVTQALLDAGASSNKRRVDGQMPLHMACVHGNVRIIDMLMDAGAEAGGVSVHKWVPLGVAAREGHHDAVFMISHVGLASCGGDTGGCTSTCSLRSVWSRRGAACSDRPRCTGHRRGPVRRQKCQSRVCEAPAAAV